MKLMITVLSVSCVLQLAAAQGCPAVAGYNFFRLQEASGSWILQKAASDTTPAGIAAACDAAPPCNAFDTVGNLMVVPMAPVFTLVDGSSDDTLSCDGTYVANGRSLSGLALQPDVDFNAIRDGGAKKAQDMQAAVTAAKQVAAKLKEKGNDPKNADKLAPGLLKQAFDQSNTPLAQADSTTGSYTFQDVLAALTYPVWDSRTANGTSYSYISPVKNQGSCGSCVAFAVTGAAEAAVAAVKKMVTNTYDFSEQWLFFCNGLYSPSCSTGWYAGAAATVLVKKNIPSEANYPYLGSYSCTLKTAPEVRAGGNFTQTTFLDITLAKQHIRTYGSVTSYFAVYNDFFYWSKTSPPYVWDRVSGLAGYHQVLTVGYNDTGSFWIVKNSWGTSWGDGGYFRISYNAGVGFMSAVGDSILGVRWVPSSGPSPSPPPPSPPPRPTCDDGVCASNETCATCAADCGKCAVCGDGICNGAETCLTCKADCGKLLANGTRTCCGDGICSASIGEACNTCPGDCGACATCNKNLICEPARGEKCVNGTSGCSDCGNCTSNYCGDGRCTWSRYYYTESCTRCPTDCGSCSGLFCGDGLCSSSRGETTLTCPRDCKQSKFTSITLGQADNSTCTGNNGNGNGNGKCNGNNGNANGGKGVGKSRRALLHAGLF